ncbi:MAG: hypothetical protein TR69_WS6001000504 [candidate division WS6 bacterium OLB20]|uniref:Uncharacterized protein n=1 Tax=candidate division WS6 bacterium OLB20 TaxID=1617426 RepID=A0A136LXW1_9BACT|nr:MAG: hypothetical protein TR69_WS6001000504 [candidate division WS6 bacterium OLB20]
MAGSANTTTLQISKKLRELESFFATKMGPQVLDYLFLFTKDESVKVEFHQLPPDVETEVRHYIELADRIMNASGIEPATGEDVPLHEKFISRLHDMYLLRYVEAKRQFAEYQLVRVPTRTEQSILNQMNLPDKADHTVPVSIHFQIPDAFVIDDDGNLDVPATLEAEATDHQIVSYFSAIPLLPSLTAQLFQDLDDITVFENATLFLREELMHVNEIVLQETIIYLTRRVYAYMDRGQSWIQGVANVKEYHRQISEGTSPDFPPDLADLGSEIERLLSEELAEIKQLEPQTRITLVEEYKELILYYIHAGILLPENYYKLEFRDPREYTRDEQRFNLLFDLYLYNDDGELLPVPFETYNIDFTQESRQQIFDAVTGGLENPDFTLTEYLSEVS